MTTASAIRTLVALATLTAIGAPKPAGAPPTRDYLVFVGSESADLVALVRFGPRGARVERQRYVGASRAEIAGPHGVAVSPDGKHYFVSIAHGVPNGYLQKYSTATDSAEGNVMLGSFPASLQVSPDGYLAYVVNFNLHGDMVPSSVSVVATAEMAEVARIETCTMPHGSRLTRDGSKHYSTCMMDEMLVEIDTRALSVSRHFLLTAGKEAGMVGAPPKRGQAAGQHAGGHGMDPPKPGDVSCSADMGGALGRRGAYLGRVQQVQRHRRDRRALVEAGSAHSRRSRRVQSRCHAGMALGSLQPTSAANRFRSSTSRAGASWREYPRAARSYTASRSRMTIVMRSSRSRAKAPSRGRWMSSI